MADKPNLILAVRGMPLAEVFAFAIEREREAQQFYAAAGGLVRDPGGKAMLAELHDEEVAHEKMLTDARDNRRVEIVGKPRGFVELGLAEIMPDVTLTPESGPQDILMRAIKKEAFAADFYAAARDATDDSAARDLFAHLNREETQHKAMLETWYDDHILTTN